MNDDFDKALARYFAGECSPAEAAEILAWASKDAARRAQMEQSHHSWEIAGSPDPRWDVDAGLAAVKSRVDDRERLHPLLPRRQAAADQRWSERMRKWLSPVALGAAAGAASLAAAASLALGYITIDLPGASATTQELVTEKGQRAQLRLADGTKVVIGPGSRLEMPAQFAMSTRTVRLSGEAYFDVTPDDQRPFVVHAGGLVTEVLGTEFNVRAYPTELRVEVVVAEGQVTVQPDGSDTATLLERGELGEVVFGETPRIATKHVDLDRQLGWLDGQLVFEDTPIREVCAELERWYGVQVQVSDSILAAQQLTASFRDQPLSEVLEVIAATLDITYSQRGRMILFLPRDSNSPNLL